MTDPSPTSSPWPPGSTEEVIWSDEDGNVLPGPKGTARGEVTVTFPDGRVERTYLEPGSATTGD